MCVRQARTISIHIAQTVKPSSKMRKLHQNNSVKAAAVAVRSESHIHLIWSFIMSIKVD